MTKPKPRRKAIIERERRLLDRLIAEAEFEERRDFAIRTLFNLVFILAILLYFHPL